MRAAQAIFFFGTIEVSGIPLSFVDIFHPKHVHWFEYEKVPGRPTASRPLERFVNFTSPGALSCNLLCHLPFLPTPSM